MSAEALKLLEECQSRGFTMSATARGTLKVSPHPDRLPPEIREELTRLKPELLRLLAATDDTPAPYLTARGELIIPCDAAPRYRWWHGGQSVRDTLHELGAPPEILAAYVARDSLK